MVVIFPSAAVQHLTRVSCNPPTRASRNHTHSTFPKWLWELLWVETPGTIESKIITGITKISCSRVTLTAKWAAEVKTRCWSMIYFQHVHAQGEKLHWCHCSKLSKELWDSELYQGNCHGLGGGLSALHSRYSFEHTAPCGGSWIFFKISIHSKVEFLLLIRKISHNLLFRTSVSEHLGTLTFIYTEVLLIYFVKPRPEILSCVSRDWHEILIITCLKKGKEKKNWLKKSQVLPLTMALGNHPRESFTQLSGGVRLCLGKGGTKAIITSAPGEQGSC